MSISTMLRGLFGVMLIILMGALAMPIYSSLKLLNESAHVMRLAQAGSAVFTALQNHRTERGPTQATLGDKDPASANFVALVGKLRARRHLPWRPCSSTAP